MTNVTLHPMTIILPYRRYSFLYIPALYFLVLLDVVMYAVMGLPFASDYRFSLVLMFTVAALLCLTRRKWLQIVFSAILLGVQVFTCVANIIAYTTLAEVFSWETITSLENAAGAAKSVTIPLWFILPLIAIIAGYIVGVVLICVYCKTPRQAVGRAWQTGVVCVLLAVGLLTNNLAYSTLPAYDDTSYVQNLSNKKFIYDTFYNRVQSFKLFGSYSYYLNNLLQIVGAYSNREALRNFGIDVQTELQPDTVGYDQIPQLHQGDNLIMILMETFEREAINPITMPNLWNFMHQSCYEVDGYYSIERTCIPDYLSQTGLHALNYEMWSKYRQVEIPFSLANMFKRAGYTTSVFHDGEGSFYSRNQLHTKALGFEHFYDYKTLGEGNYSNECFNYNRDEDLFVNNLERMAPADQDFYSYIISISTHALWPGYDISTRYPDEFKLIDDNLAALKALYPWLSSTDPDEVQIIKNYLAGTASFDQGFGVLLKRLRETDDLTNPGKKLIETTAIIMFGDHYYYAQPQAVVPENDNPAELLGNRCPMIIYNPYASSPEQPDVTYAANTLAKQPQSLGQTIQRFTATMDIYKTACSLFGIVTDQQITYGHSVFADQPSVGIGYINGAIWGITDGEPWRTTDFQTFWGKTLTPAEIDAVVPMVDKTYRCIMANMVLLETNNFKYMSKCTDGRAYCLLA